MIPSDPAVSVVLPTFNRARFLPDAVESVLRQTETRWELMLADDGSTDETADYLRSLTDPRIHVLRLDHVGHPGEVRNRALVQCRGRYVAFLDSDDWWEPEKLALQLAVLSRRPECGWSYTSFRLIGRDGVSSTLLHVPPVAADGTILESVLAGEAYVLTSTLMVERQLLDRAGGFDPDVTVASDLDMWVRLAGLSVPAPVAEVLVTKRQHAGNYTLAYRDSVEVLERVNRRLLSRVQSPRLRAVIHARRAKWLIGAADRRRNDGRYREAWAALIKALPAGARSAHWWKAALKTSVHPLLPRWLFSLYRRRRTRAS